MGPLGFEATDTPAYATGSIDGQDGWESDGAAPASPGLDHAVDDVAASGTEPDDFGFGEQSLRISNAVGSGAFANQTFSKPTADFAGESTAASDGQTTGDRGGYFETSWDFSTAGNPLAEQEDLNVVASPDRGDGARMSWIQMADCNNEDNATPPFCSEPGLEVNFYEYDGDETGDPGLPGFVSHNVATGLSRLEAHSIKVRMWFFEGVDNDVVEVCVNGTECVVGNSWEDYFREQEMNPTRPVDSVLFRTSAAAPGTAGNGVFIDNFTSKALDYDGANVSVQGPSNIAEDDTTAQYTITLNEPLPFTVEVPYETVAGTATADDDFDSHSGTATFVPGDTSEQVSVGINEDGDDEAHEHFRLDIDAPVAIGRGPGDGSDDFVRRHNNGKRTTIRDDESTVSISDGGRTEPSTGLAGMGFTVSLANPSDSPVTVRLDTANGSATAPADYRARTNVTVTFNPGQVSRTVLVNIAADDLVEGNENFSVNLSNPNNAVIGDGTGAGVIDDADD